MPTATTPTTLGVDDPADADAPATPAGSARTPDGRRIRVGVRADRRRVRPEQREWKPPAGWAEPVEWRAPAEWTGAMPVVAAAAQDAEGGVCARAGAGAGTDELEDRTSEQLDGEPATSIPEDSDRPWETYVKLESDVEADRFFGSFDDGLDARRVGAFATPTEGEPLVTAMETPAATDLGGSAPHWHEQPEPLSAADRHPGEDDRGRRDDAEDDAEADEPGAQHPEADPRRQADADQRHRRGRRADTGSFGTIGDLSAEWADAERDDDDTTEGGEPR